MVIGKGTAYGTEQVIDPAWPSLWTDAQLAAHIAEFGQDPCTITGGDILTTLGGGATEGVPTLAYPVDLLIVSLDGTEFTAVAHVVARRRLWAGQFFVAMNAAWVDGLYLGPRSHPNDGLVDATSGSLPAQQRVMARRRARTGTHLPHPNLKMVRKPRVSASFERPVWIHLDGQPIVKSSEIVITVRADAGLVVV